MGTYGSDRRLLSIPSWRVGDISSQEDDRLLEHWRPVRKGVTQASDNEWMSGIIIPLPSGDNLAQKWTFPKRSPAFTSVPG